jgi:hypothetical protein
MVLDVAKDSENSWEPPEEELLPVEAEQPVRMSAATVGTARAPTFRPELRRCCVMSSLSDFIVQNPGVVTPVTHKYAGDVPKTHISIRYDGHKSNGGPRKVYPDA